MTMYNISAALGNNYFKLSNITLNVSYVITIPDGQYDLTGLQTVINNQISLLSYNNIIYNNILTYLVFDITGNHSRFYRTIRPGAASPNDDYDLTIDFAVDKYGNFDKYNFKTKLGWLLGYRNVSYTITMLDFGNNSPKYANSDVYIDLNVNKYLYLAIDEFSKSNPNSFITPLPTSLINKSIISRISLDKAHYGFNTIMTANMFNGLLISDERTYSGKIDLQKINIQLLNEFGYPISLNGMDFSLCLEVEYE
jgi:hypothetical protein